MTAPQLVPAVVPSYVADRWWQPSGAVTAEDIHDAATGDVIARVSTTGLDVAAAVDHARSVGRRRLGRTTLHERALLIKELALYLDDPGRKQQLYDLSAATGATRADSMIDVDGGIGVLFTMSSRGRRELPNSNLIIDGGIEVISPDGSFVGTHVYTRIPGVLVQINAFNFPIWGMLEKFAPAFIAGVPSIVKPAVQTGYLAEAAVRMMLESGVLPDGAIQLVSGGAVDFLEYLDHRDAVQFTGSSAVAHRLRGHRHVVEGGVRLTCEADSLNAAILAPDAEVGSPEFTAFVRSVAVEMTAKAGQKCTAVRRILVPTSMVDAVAEAIGAALERRVVGDPRSTGTTMGALVSTDQLQATAERARRMAASGGELVWGDLSDDLGGSGAFMTPKLFRWADAGNAVLHSMEAFGPISGIVGYRTLDEAVALAARGGGSLVATVCTNDPDTARRLVLGIAAHHGRVLILNREDERTSTGHGSPMPMLTHGGPGRAGGGEELGGVRAILHTMQRTALQGSPDMLTAVTGVWHPGARRRCAGDPTYGGSPDEVHPFRKSLVDLRVGDAYASSLRPVRPEDIAGFADQTGDTFYAHTHPQAAAANPFFPGIVAHGYLLVSWAAGLFVDPAPGPVLANYGLDHLRFRTPVSAGDAIRVTLTAKRITPRVTDDYGEVVWDTVLHNQHGEIVATYDVLTLVAKTWPLPPTQE
ncbi:Bifunctional protein PaaZ [Austwickia sp. TVS 96-490-7B]|uniref:phenylacetic acid degradation bifunctional protein PaaZ n=1 Tax=Austwickia sp. TVS 96-490-7B TaxID=2830843 RepID=UPI001C55F7B6|nr:phenylacetic acid degradation bifunctional protein PaaZ [Austwickia sp. TVS 96-490-7B]MBW3085274.1 Bifunctional protein PaaZ [Austwickia sp. TVS 96-490-7B]